MLLPSRQPDLYNGRQAQAEAQAAMLFIVAIFVVITVAVAFVWFAPTITTPRIIFDVRPDRPAPFGYKMGWIAVRSIDTIAVVEALGLVGPVISNWDSGIGTVYDDQLGERRLFVSPPVDGWTFVVGLALPHPMSPAFIDKWTPMLDALAARFKDVQYYFSYPLIDFYAWAKYTDGKLVRAFATSDAGTVLSRGKPTREEKALGLKLFELRGVRERRGDAGGEIILHPTEDHVMRLAAKWSIDPTTFGPASASQALGWIAEAPAHWRPERLRKSA